VSGRCFIRPVAKKRTDPCDTLSNVKEEVERVVTSVEKLRKRYNPKQIRAIFDRKIYRIKLFRNFFFVRQSEFEKFLLCERISINVTTCQNETFCFFWHSWAFKTRAKKKNKFTHELVK
jgi:hypothetical protein